MKKHVKKQLKRLKPESMVTAANRAALVQLSDLILANTPATSIPPDLLETARPCINDRLSVDQKDTLLHLAAAHGNVGLIKMLIDRGADVNIPDAQRRTPLFHVPAAAAEARQALLDSGAIDDEEYFFMDQPEFDTSVGVSVGDTFMRKLLLAIVAPFIVLLLVNGFWFLIKFTVGVLVFYFLIVGYFLSELMVLPSWYRYNPKAKRLTMRDLPEAWRGFAHDPKHHFGYDFEDVKFRTSDGFTLSGWYVPPSPDVTASPMALVFTHGGGRDRRAWLRHLPMFRDRGFTCLLYDLREHGLSSGSGKGLSFGFNERHDVVAAARYLRDQRGFGRVAVIGTSIGAAATVMGAALAPDAIDVVVLENPMLSCGRLQEFLLQRVIVPYFRGTRWSRLVFLIFRKICSVWLNARLGNIPSRRIQPLYAVPTISPRPLLLMHGTYDTVVPPSHSQKLFELAHEPKRLWIAPEASHCCLYDKHPDEFERHVVGFLKTFEKGATAAEYEYSPRPPIAFQRGDSIYSPSSNRAADRGATVSLEEEEPQGSSVSSPIASAEPKQH
jgi:pimeloyl-ACP methyl ester carboxylesterase